MGTLLNINCYDAESISFEINIPDIAEWEGSTDQRSWSLNDIAGCEPTFAGGKVMYSGINVAVCDPYGPFITDDNSKFEYRFVISVDAEAGSTTSPVTFAYDHDYVVKCFYNREQENIMASFQPRHSLTDSGSGKSKSSLEQNSSPMYNAILPVMERKFCFSLYLLTTLLSKISHKN